MTDPAALTDEELAAMETSEWFGVGTEDARRLIADVRSSHAEVERLRQELEWLLSDTTLLQCQADLRSSRAEVERLRAELAETTRPHRTAGSGW